MPNCPKRKSIHAEDKVFDLRHFRFIQFDIERLHFSHFDFVHFRLSVEKGHVPGVHTIPTGNTQNSYIYLFAKIGENKDMREIIFQETTFSRFSRLDNPPSFTRLTHSGVDAVRNKSARTRASAMLE